MVNTLFNFSLTAMSVAGIAVLWRNWLEDHDTWKRWVKEKFGPASKALTCGSCFTYWLALIFTLVAKPLTVWMPLGNSFSGIIGNIFLQWMALSWISVFLRFAYVAIQELVSYQVHKLREHDHT